MMGKSTASRLKRRDLLGGLVTLPLTAPPLLAEARLNRARRPLLRGGRTLVADPAARSVRAAIDPGLSGQTSFVLRDLQSGAMLEAHAPDLAQPPASVAKVPTALYALAHLGGRHRYATRVVATGPIAQGRVQGDLYLVGGGDPTLDTDGIANLVAQLVKRGIHGVTGRAFVVDPALPYAPSIDPDQPDFVGYNPAISGLNLNFNRVHFEWKRTAQGYSTLVSARSARRDPRVQSVDVRIVDRKAPVFAYRSIEGRDHWTVARSALGRRGARWLPVRACRTYAGDVFRAVGEEFGLRLPSLRLANRVPQGTVVAELRSDPLADIMVGMLKHSTNLTAEVAGLSASVKRGAKPARLEQSGAAMSDWLRQRYGLSQLRLVNHSGLSVASRMTAAETVQLLDIAAAETALPKLLKDIPVAAEKGSKARLAGVSVRAKTGTLNFTRGLAGYLQSGGRQLAFAIYASDLPSRRAAKRGEVPRGARSWRGRAVNQEQALLRHWARTYLS